MVIKCPSHVAFGSSECWAPSSNNITPAEDEPDDVDFDNEDMVPTDDTSEVEDKAEDWEYDKLFVGQCIRGLNENGWFNGVVVYYSRLHVFF